MPSTTITRCKVCNKFKGKNGCKYCENKEERKEIRKRVKKELKQKKKEESLLDLEEEEPIEEPPKQIKKVKKPLKMKKSDFLGIIEKLKRCELIDDDVEPDSDE